MVIDNRTFLYYPIMFSIVFLSVSLHQGPIVSYDRELLEAEPTATSLSTGPWYKETEKKPREKYEMIKMQSSALCTHPV